VTAVFADTFYWIAVTTPDDSAYARALEFSRSRPPDQIVTTDEVLSEYLTFFSGMTPGVRRQAGDNAVALLRNPRVKVMPQSRESFLAGIELYRARPDKGYSLTDCISMITMRHEGLTEALTNDRHFEQEGFRALFRAG
jgi:predicted nucleic acid-binding protein